MIRLDVFASKLRYAIVLGIMALSACAGCWEQIEYTGSFRDETTSPAAPSIARQSSHEQPIEPAPAADPSGTGAETDAASFGEDLAESLPEPAASTADDLELLAPSQDVLPAEPTASSTERDRYAMPAAETSANYASSDWHHDEIAPPVEGAPIADAVDPPAAYEPNDSANSALAAWQLGSKLSLAVLANDRGVAAENVRQWVADCKLLAESLGTTTTDLPQPAPQAEELATSRQALNYLLSQGQRVGRDLARQHSDRHPALFEIALKSNLLRVLYEPDSSVTEKISVAIADAAKRAELPADLLQPLMDTLSANADINDVRNAVQILHADVAQHLAGEVER